ncbi:glutamine--fructose-6-phosphate transaminase (isomerizing) [Blattabacterium cuenoti]|uniref:glutamine--fructose-6-phosphate transaminase (isomerizing) n=1 Tax=Blattabacterium cuenoti TaxID=1653831 RepID=UPI00163BCD31|nr:glutamine--fructose-6-phosphate transaminase (isomerizing) [Blattabacterium cuenoti]
MCGIIGYLGYRDAYPIIINGLKKLEYRGYDSSGIAILYDGGYCLYKTKGRVCELEKKISYNINIKGKKGTTGIGHTRWATHGIPNDINAHPHVSNSNELILIHNGIIENYHAIKIILSNKGFTFKSKTDTEVLVNLIEYIKNENKLSLEEAVRISLNEIIGAYSIAIVEKSHPERIVIAKLGSPLALGINDKEFFIASDPIPFLNYTRNVLDLKDGEMAILKRNNELDLRQITNNHKLSPSIRELHINLKKIEKGGYQYFMLKEIYEQPKTIFDTLRGRLSNELICIEGIESNIDRFINAKSITIVACGTSWHASLIGEYLLEDFAKVPVEVEYASEFRYRNPIIEKKDIVIVISQSGETADTIAALKLAKEKGAFVFGICNVVGSFIARNVDAGMYTHAGPEIGVASTKSFTAQITVLFLLALKIGKQRSKITNYRYKLLCKELGSITEKVKTTLKIDNIIDKISINYHNVENFLYLGRGINFPVALEGALKLKEISYIHAEGYPAAEMKHGPIALIDEKMPVVIIATQNSVYEKIIGNIQEIKARKGKIIAIVNKGDFQASMLADHIIEIPKISEELSPILTVLPLQLLAYKIAYIRGKNVDQPRNLAKSVTVE